MSLHVWSPFNPQIMASFLSDNLIWANPGLAVGFAIAEIANHFEDQLTSPDTKSELRNLVAGFDTYIRRELLHSALREDLDNLRTSHCALVLGVSCATVIQRFAETNKDLESSIGILLASFIRSYQHGIGKGVATRDLMLVFWCFLFCLLNSLEHASLVHELQGHPMQILTFCSREQTISSRIRPFHLFMERFCGHCILCGCQFFDSTRAQVSHLTWTDWVAGIDAGSSLAKAPLQCTLCLETACSQCFMGGHESVKTMYCPFCGARFWVGTSSLHNDMLWYITESGILAS